MSTHAHHWNTSEGNDGGLHHCRKCGRDHQGPRPKSTDCPVSDAEHNAVAWLGPAGLYPTRLDAVQNGEQCLEPVSADQLFSYARALVQMQVERHHQANFEGCKTEIGKLADVLPTVAVEGDQLVIRITTESLMHAVTCNSQWPVDATGEPIRIENGALMVQEIIHELQREDEQGTNQMHHLFDNAALRALENGSEAVNYGEVN
ncbi:hypothetical protein ACQJ0O_12735 [Pseudomonas shirazensis]|uniref:hypothetical protein n=1 Tax=Pseudomonas shirazensis TaxID=2745494 RepID=UPI003D012DBD